MQLNKCIGPQPVQARQASSYGPAVPRSNCHRNKTSLPSICNVTLAAPRLVTASAAAEEVNANLQDDGGLELNNASFHAISLEGCEFLLASHDGGKVDLNDVYVKDDETGIFARPTVIGQMPDEPHKFVEMEWAEEYTGDTLMGKKGFRKVHKVYLVKVEQEDPFRVNLEEVYSVDHQTRVLQKELVSRTTNETDPTLITLRIRADGLLIERNQDMISDWDLVEAWHVEEERQRVATAVAAMDESEDAVIRDEDGPRDPIVALNDDEREYDETFEDTPEVDQGYGD